MGTEITSSIQKRYTNHSLSPELDTEIPSQPRNGHRKQWLVLQWVTNDLSNPEMDTENTVQVPELTHKFPPVFRNGRRNYWLPRNG